MRFVRVPAHRDRVPYPIIFGVVALLAAVAAWARISLTLEWIPSLCLFRRLTGFPCPACHATRALSALLTGKIGAALAFNPLVTLSALGSALAALASLARRLTGREALALEFEPGEQVALRAAAVLLIAGNWVYLVASR
jgi:hypothetical protein